MEIISQGAEAIIIKEKNNVLKKRIKKSYRIQEIDERLRKTRTKRETKILERAKDLIPVPKILDSCDKDMTIKMEFIDGLKLSEVLDSLKNKYEIAELIGKQIAILHNNNRLNCRCKPIKPGVKVLAKIGNRYNILYSKHNRIMYVI